MTDLRTTAERQRDDNREMATAFRNVRPARGTSMRRAPRLGDRKRHAVTVRFDPSIIRES